MFPSSQDLDAQKRQTNLVMLDVCTETYLSERDGMRRETEEEGDGGGGKGGGKVGNEGRQAYNEYDLEREERLLKTAVSKLYLNWHFGDERKLAGAN